MAGCDCGMIPCPHDKRRRLEMNKSAGSGPITAANFADQVGPVSAAVLMTEHKMRNKKHHGGSKILPDVIVKAAEKLDDSIELLNRIIKER